MAKYVYPAIFTKEDTGYSVEFPDIESCYTCGESLQEALEMAEDALSLMLVHFEDEGRTIPTPSDLSTSDLPANSFTNYVKADTLEYRKLYSNKAVKKTLSIPEWLNERAMAMNLNFSQVLQEALLNKIQL